MPHQPGSSLNKKSAASKNKAPSKAGDKLIHLAFDNTAQANIITVVSNGKIVMANAAASRLLGYSRKELLTKNRSAIFNVKESSFKKMLQQRTTKGYSVAVVTVVKKNGKTVTCQITSAVFINETGKQNAITSIADMSKAILLQRKLDIEKEKITAGNIILAEARQKLVDAGREKIVAENIVIALARSDARIAENNEWVKYIAKASYDVMWDWDLATGEIYAGDSIREVFGYRIQNNTVLFSDFCKCLLPEEKEITAEKIRKTLASQSKVWNDSFMFKRYDGTVASVTSRASIVRDDSGKATHMIGAIQDVSRLQEMEKKLAEQKMLQQEDSEKFLLAARLSFDVIWDWNLLTNEVFLGDGFEELFGYVINNNRANMITDWVNNLHPDDKETVVAELQAGIKSSATHWEQAYRVSRANGSIAMVYVRASIIRHADGKAYRMIGAMQDLSRQKELEAELEQEIELREKQVAMASEDAREMERADIGKELHDNINQLLGASKMYMDMAKRGGNSSAMYLSRSSEYTLTAIDEIRKLTRGLTTDIIKNLGLCDAMENIARDTMEISPVKVLLNTNSFIENSVNDKFKLNIFRIIQEQLNNILKHAEATKISIKLVQNKRTIRLVITDDGTGFNAHKKQKGIGIVNITSRIAAYDGIADFDSQPGQGCILTAIFPVTARILI